MDLLALLDELRIIGQNGKRYAVGDVENWHRNHERLAREAAEHRAA
jgi:hypothetical protein